MTSTNVIDFTNLTREQAADQAIMNRILDRAEKIRAKCPVNRGELVGVAHDLAIKARLRGDAEAEQHFIHIAAEFMAMKVDDTVECATTHETILHKLIATGYNAEFWS